MVGYGKKYPRQVHHRGSFIVSVKVDPSFVSCRGGYVTWFSRKASDPNLLTGAIVGGPDAYENFADHSDNYEQTEPATYNNAPLLGDLAWLHGRHRGNNQLLPVEIPVAEPIVVQPQPDPVKETSFAAPIAIEEKQTTSWVANGKTYYIYSAIVTNKSAVWGLTKSPNGSYRFPTWISSLEAGKSMEFVYIHSASPIEVSISSYTLA